ncbi:MbcA/ParS/Xre antitoxin family protein [Mesorhizobium sp. BR1-1-16]|uniref:MbcA/ParS/Xre antitoxin family protein n=1 Tax=Mesorhizobium sp. BR1-1-16 TaxID=2876653 RepID=UPI001CCE4089|nr:MbcA/ParS/Xre antitoxin family protein [Mesorhizobium sp. BR1-1-16]MBZ9936087.1 MbcA/ParS/Xre antitoxin family protein [Mesorhizobium sp. BR1-1-16]
MILSPTPAAAAPAGESWRHFSAADRKRLGGPGLRSFVAIADLWGLTEAERMRMLGLPGRSTYFGWLAKVRTDAPLILPLDTLLRISAVLGIHKALRILFAADADALFWLRAPNSGPLFGGQPPLALAANGTQDGLMLLRRHLDAWRGGLFSAPLPALDDVAAPIDDSDIVWA